MCWAHRAPRPRVLESLASPESLQADSARFAKGIADDGASPPEVPRGWKIAEDCAERMRERLVR